MRAARGRGRRHHRSRAERKPRCSKASGSARAPCSGWSAVGYHLLGLRTYLTTGEKETRAWTFYAGSTAPECAGRIHSDFQRGFIKAEVIHWDELLEIGSWNKAKELGKIRIEGKDYRRARRRRHGVPLQRLRSSDPADHPLRRSCTRFQGRSPWKRARERVRGVRSRPISRAPSVDRDSGLVGRWGLVEGVEDGAAVVGTERDCALERPDQLKGACDEAEHRRRRGPASAHRQP